MNVYEYLLLNRRALEDLVGGYISDEVFKEAARVLEAKNITSLVSDKTALDLVVTLAAAEKISDLKKEVAQLKTLNDDLRWQRDIARRGQHNYQS